MKWRSRATRSGPPGIAGRKATYGNKRRGAARGDQRGRGVADVRRYGRDGSRDKRRLHCRARARGRSPRAARPGETAIPLDDSFHNVRENEAFARADLPDARWIARYMAQITGTLSDLGLNYPPIKPMDDSEEFDYDPQRDGLISIVTSRNEIVTAPDDDWVIVKGRAYTRAEVKSGASARDIAKAQKSKLAHGGRQPPPPGPGAKTPRRWSSRCDSRFPARRG